MPDDKHEATFATPQTSEMRLITDLGSLDLCVVNDAGTFRYKIATFADIQAKELFWAMFDEWTKDAHE